METCSSPHPPVPLPRPPPRQSHPHLDQICLPRRCAGIPAHASALRAGACHPRLWNELARAYAAEGSSRLALLVCLQMPARDKYTFPLAFRMCSLLSAFREGACLHAQLHKLGLACDVYSVNALLSMYFDGGQEDCARRLFDGMRKRTVASWTSHVIGLERQSLAHEAMGVFRNMLDAGVRADEAAIVGALSACTQCSCLEFGTSVHAHSIVMGLGLDLVALATALVDMYAKSGAIDVSRAVFERMSNRNVFSWSAMIGGLAMHGLGPEALSLFNEMTEVGLKPTPVTMTNVFTACSHAGLVEEGWKYFALMKEAFGMEPRIEHLGCIVDLLGRAGLLAQALDFVERMPVEPSGAIWRSLLGAASTHGDLRVGELAVKKLASVEDPVAGDYVMLANLYAKFSCWEDVGRVRTKMNDSKTRKVAGYSSLEVDGVVHKFVMGDRSHPQSDSIYEMLGAVNEVLVLEDSTA
ncbi:hypothetical protein Taro_003461 [Colocasia esculenta]|uniref:Pentatricopeptide repeat-containing protein n=1 Tax=Colocasia esculenta TaxID=4460 RepID=A0A843TH58_COLES|nr:hypothetical protein [Colocasia esculenta]